MEEVTHLIKMLCSRDLQKARSVGMRCVGQWRQTMSFLRAKSEKGFSITQIMLIL